MILYFKRVINFFKNDSASFRSYINSHRLLSTLCFLIFIIPASITLSDNYKSYQHEIEKIENSTQSVITALDYYIKLIFETSEHLITEVDFIQKLGPHLSKLEMSQQLEKISKQYPYIEVIATTNEKGDYIANSAWMKNFDKLSIEKKGISNRPHFKFHQNNESMGVEISDPIKSNTTGNMVVIFSRRASSVNNKFSGIIVIGINIEKISEILKNVARDNSQEMALSLFNAKRIILARYPYKKEQIGTFAPMNPSMVPLVNAGFRSGNYQGVSTIDSLKKVFSFRYIGNTSFHILGATPITQVYNAWLKSFIFLLCLYIFIFIITVIVLIRYFQNVTISNQNRQMATQSSKMAALGEMAAGIAHEINNPLTIIKGNLLQIKRRNDNLSNIETKIEHMENSVQRISKIVNGLKKFSHSSENEPSKIQSIDNLIRESLELVKINLSNKNINVQMELELIGEILINEIEFEQVMVNLLNNAADAIKNNEDKWIKIRSHRDGSKIIIQVIDSGTGITSEVEQKIFQPFFTTKSLGEGTGLGLSISKGLIEKNGGNLLYNRSVSNTCFELHFPLAKS